MEPLVGGWRERGCVKHFHIHTVNVRAIDIILLSMKHLICNIVCDIDNYMHTCTMYNNECKVYIVTSTTQME